MAPLDFWLLLLEAQRGFVVGMRGMSRRVPLVAVASLLVIAVACSTSNDETLKSNAGASPGATTTSVEPTTTVELPTTLAEPTATSEPTGASEPLTAPPGEPVDWFIAGTAAQVAGVAFDETFVIRTLPGEDQPVAATLPSLTELVLTGNGRDIDQGTFSIAWAEVTGAGVTGWIPQWSLVYLGAPRDVTAEAVTTFGHLPTAPTMLELGTIVIDELAPLDPDSAGANIVRANEPSAGPTSEVVYDEFPGEKFGDDAAAGGRYRVIGRQVPVSDLPTVGFASALAYELVSVEVRALCTRGVSSGFCV